MYDFSNLPITELLGEGGFACGCGKRHRVALRHLALGPGALGRLPEVLRACGVGRPFVVMDENTREAAGNAVCSLLAASGMDYRSYCFPQEHVEPDEAAVGQAALAFDRSFDQVLAVGSGTINDICKILSAITAVPLTVVATAPSMDGYSSNTSAMICGGVKVTVDSVCPQAIVADTDILSRAPMRMLQAGLGDILAKYVSTCEWRISHLVNGEYYCEGVAAMMRRAVKKCAARAADLALRDPLAVQEVAEAMILSGIAMSFAGVSRPASGLEHYFSHIWEMRALEAGRPYDLHGIQVGVGTLLTLKLYEWLREARPDRYRALASAASFDGAAWEADMRRIFGTAAHEVLRIERETGKHDRQKHAARLERILAIWPEILAIIGEELPDYQEVLAVMRSAGEPATPAEIGISPGEVRDALLASMEIRDKYIGSRLMCDLGLLGEMTERLGEFCGSEA